MAAEELRAIWPKLVQGLSDETINELLDDFIQDKVLSRGEAKSVRGVNLINTVKARNLLDTVCGKGDLTSGKLIEHLKKRDPHLHSVLFTKQSCDESAPQAAAAAPQKEWSSTLKHSTEKFWREKQLDEDVYPAFKNTLKNRVALLITNIDFAKKNLCRSGAAKDEENMDLLLSFLGYEVVKYTNLTAQKMDEAVQKFSQHPKLRDTDSVIVVIMSHGKLGSIYGVNYDEAPDNKESDVFCIDNICKHLNTLSCPQLEGKPKIVMIQACRGDDSGSYLICDGPNLLVADSPSTTEGNLEADDLRYVPREEDFVFLFSSTPHSKSYRHPVNGSILVQGVMEEFSTYAHEDHLEDLFRRVINWCRDHMKGCQLQVPSKDRCTLRKKFYFFPGI